MQIWQFMKSYADGFWLQTEASFECFSVIVAWAITLGLAFCIACIIGALGSVIADFITGWKKDDDHG